MSGGGSVSKQGGMGREAVEVRCATEADEVAASLLAGIHFQFH